MVSFLKELEEFKAIIDSKLKEAKEDLVLLKGSLSHKDDHGTDDTGRSFNMMDDGSETLMREEMAQLAARQEKFIKNLENVVLPVPISPYKNKKSPGRITLLIFSAIFFNSLGDEMFI